MVVGVRRPRRVPTVTSASRRSERGAVTAEAAAVLPLLVALTLGLVWVVSLAATHVRVVDTAREVARAEARGDTARDVGSGSSRVDYSVHRQGERVRVVATSEVDGPGGLFRALPPVTLTSTAWAVQEPTS
jgi:Flp pilus assembly protein TadG